MAGVLLFHGLFAAPCRADILPESGLLVHARPVEGSCSSGITHCEQINRTSAQEGPVEFLLFFMTGAFPFAWESRGHRPEPLEPPICIASLHTVLTWPQSWQLLEFEPCGHGGDGTLESGGTTHALDLAWTDKYYIGLSRNSVIPVARLVMNVAGPGRLSFGGGGNVTLVRGCTSNGPVLVTYPAQVFAEAGIQCGHLAADCGYLSYCHPAFQHPELVLNAPAGGTADTTFSLPGPYWLNCGFVAESHATWCAALLETLEWNGYYFYKLHVTADATGLLPGMYETWIEVIATGDDISRCLRTTFIVDDATATSSTSWGRVKSLYR
jgi:hypothetical protein